jgi:hypothetical protein
MMLEVDPLDALLQSLRLGSPLALATVSDRVSALHISPKSWYHMFVHYSEESPALHSVYRLVLCVFVLFFFVLFFVAFFPFLFLRRVYVSRKQVCQHMHMRTSTRVKRISPLIEQHQHHSRYNESPLHPNSLFRGSFNTAFTIEHAHAYTRTHMHTRTHVHTHITSQSLQRVAIAPELIVPWIGPPEVDDVDYRG